MALIARILLFFALLWPCAAFAQEGGDVDPCDGGPLETRSVLRCRDGDPTCDIDGACDGMCVVRSCVTYPKNPASRLVTTRFARAVPTRPSLCRLFLLATDRPSAFTPRVSARYASRHADGA